MEEWGDEGPVCDERDSDRDRERGRERERQRRCFTQKACGVTRRESVRQTDRDRESESARARVREKVTLLKATFSQGSGPEVGLNADVEFVSSWLKNLAAPSASEKGAVDPLEARRLDLETSLRTTVCLDRRNSLARRNGIL